MTHSLMILFKFEERTVAVSYLILTFILFRFHPGRLPQGAAHNNG